MVTPSKTTHVGPTYVTVRTVALVPHDKIVMAATVTVGALVFADGLFHRACDTCVQGGGGVQMVIKECVSKKEELCGRRCISARMQKRERGGFESKMDGQRGPNTDPCDQKGQDRTLT
jgi:hypothetical protein